VAARDSVRRSGNTSATILPPILRRRGFWAVDGSCIAATLCRFTWPIPRKFCRSSWVR